MFANDCIFLLILICTQPAWGSLILLNEDTSSGEATGIQNCTCPFSLPCTASPSFVTVICSCVATEASGIATVASDASDGNHFTWWYTDSLTICCNSMSSDSAKTLLDNLLDFSFQTRLTLGYCGGLISTTIDVLTIYGLQEVALQTDTSANYPNQYVEMTQTDEGDESRNYRDHHIAFLSKNSYDGDLKLQSWSVVSSIYDDQLTDTMNDALLRAPDSVRGKSDGNVMMTPIYV
ncbi:uncharacterized protein LOC143448676 isoform X1 [Clavelina lepadiformis]|uniref:uncharacterized protein LOC143448676 isoform X1 n=2 Tax=Clavelina lepadiformis TaxID=159417 RepID=UPI00404322F0